MIANGDSLKFANYNPAMFAWYEASGFFLPRHPCGRQDVPALVAEVRRLRAALRDCVFLWDRGEAIAPDQGEADNARAALGRMEGQ